MKLLKATVLALALTTGCTYNSYLGRVQSEVDGRVLADGKLKGWTQLECDDVAVIGLDGANFFACSDAVSKEMVDNLGAVAEVKEYIREDLGLLPSTNYIVYNSDSGEDEAITLYSLLVVPKLELPEEGNFIWASLDKDYSKHYRAKKGGTLYFQSYIDDLLDEREHYGEKGYDLYYRKMKDFSSGGGELGASIRPDFFEAKEAFKIEDVIHEDWHYYISVEKPDLGENNYLDESSASLIGLAGAMDFAAKKYGEDSSERLMAEVELEWWYKYSLFINHYHRVLKNLYKSDLPDEEKLEMKEKIINGAKEVGYAGIKKCIDNAYLMEKNKYTRYFPLLYHVYKKQGFDKTVDIMKKMPDTSSGKKAAKYLKKFI